MRVLYIGGTGEISYSCVQAGVALGQEVSVFNRGRSTETLPESVRQIIGDLADDASYRALGKQRWDVVCQFKAFDVKTIERDIEVFGGRCGQYVFISSASAYQKPPQRPVITEQTPLDNPFWPYSDAKRRVEERLLLSHAQGILPLTIVRPSHTYRKNFPGTVVGGDHMAWRILQGQPVVVHGDGTSLWVVTHAEDFAVPFVRLLGNPRALGQAFHITSDEVSSWNQIIGAIGDALGTEAKLVHVPTDSLIRLKPDWLGSLWGDKSHSVIFDNSKVKSVAGDWTCKVTMREGMKRVAEVYRQRQDAYVPDPKVHAMVDKLIAEQAAVGRA